MDIGLLNQIKSYLSSSLEGQSIENQKVDFKRKWYSLNDERGVYQFLKDTSAIANTVGLDGFIIIGFDDKTKDFYDCVFSDCGITDSEQIPGIISKYVDRIYDVNHYDVTIENHKLSILHIPPSLDKPHVIRLYKSFDKEGLVKSTEQHRAFVKRSTSTGFASKYDLELMYYDRKNIIPEYKILSSLHYPSVDYTAQYYYVSDVNYASIKFQLPITLENLGRRPVAITVLNLILTGFEDPTPSELLELNTSDQYKKSPIIIHPNEIVNKVINFDCNSLTMVRGNDAINKINHVLSGKKNLATKFIDLELANGQILKSDLLTI